MVRYSYQFTLSSGQPTTRSWPAYTYCCSLRGQLVRVDGVIFCLLILLNAYVVVSEGGGKWRHFDFADHVHPTVLTDCSRLEFDEFLR